MSRICGTFVCLCAASMLFTAGCGGGDKGKGKEGGGGDSGKEAGSGGKGAATPEEAFKGFKAAIQAKDADKTWALLSAESRKVMEAQVDAMKEGLKKLDSATEEQRKMASDMYVKMFGMKLEELKKLDGKGMLSISFKMFEGKEENPFKDVGAATLEKVKVEGDKAKGKVKTPTKTEDIEFVKEDGSWKVTLPMPGGKGP
jgi:hypothetical protein